MPPIIPNRFLVRVCHPCPFVKDVPRGAEDRLLDLPASARLDNFAELDGAHVKWCADKRPDRLALVKKRYPSISVTEDPQRIFNDPEVNAVVIATPVSAHYLLAKQALEHGKHVLVEKPMTRSVAEGQELLELADKKRLVLMVDHTFIYTGAVRKMKEVLDGEDLGELYYLDSVRDLDDEFLAAIREDDDQATTETA